MTQPGRAAPVAPEARSAASLELGPRRSDRATLAAVSAHFALVFAPVYLTAAIGPGWSSLAFWLWFGLLSAGALLLLHECAHKLLFQDVRWNEFLAVWIVAPLFLADFEAFRRRHWAHHRELGRAGDPKYTYRMDVSGRRLPRFAISSLLLVEAVRRTLYQTGERSEKTSHSSHRTLLATALVQAGLFGSLLLVSAATHRSGFREVLLSAAVAYGFVYLYGVASLGVLMHALRGIIEHRPCDPDESREGEAALRNFSEGALQRLLFGTYGFTEHATHHALPGVPYYQLPAATRRVRAADPTLAPVGSHAAVLARLVARAPQGARSSTR
jgi:fatty acid desaturase